MNDWRNTKIRCQHKDCETEFYPSDPRAAFCNKHHFSLIAAIASRLDEGDPLGVVSDEMRKAREE